MKRLAAAQADRFRTDGALSPIPVLDAGEVAAALRALDEIELRLGANYQRIDHLHMHFRWALDLTRHPAVLDALEDILGPDLLLHSSRIFYKRPHDGSYVNWHQDGIYSRLNETSAVTAWIALSDSAPDNGCVRVIPGSHRGGKVAHRETFAALNLNNHGEEVEVDVDERRAHDFVLAPGEMSLHDINIVHSSYPNHSARSRIGFSATYTTPEAPESAASYVQVRGNAAAPHLRLFEADPPLTIADGLAAYDAYVRANGVRGPRIQERATA